MKKRIEVVGAVIIRDDLILCAQRGSTAKLPGMWEFPGGKIESGESPSEALVREITEELSCVIEVDEYINTAEYEYDFGIVILSTFYCSLISGEPKLSEHDGMVWLRPDELQKLDWAPADLPAVAAIQEVAKSK